MALLHCVSKPLPVNTITAEKKKKITVEMKEGQKGIFFILNEMQSLDAVSSFDKVAAQCRRALRPDAVNSAIMSL